MGYRHSLGATTWTFAGLTDLMAKASPLRSGDVLAGLAARSEEERAVAKFCLADVPLRDFLSADFIPYETDEVTRLIHDSHDRAAFAAIAHLTVGGFRDWLLSDAATPNVLARLAPGLMPEMVASVSKLMRNQDLILAARKVEVVTRFRNTIGLRGTMAVRLQPNHPTDDARGIAASIVDGLLYGCGDATIGINPASDNLAVLGDLCRMIDEIINRLAIPTQGCVLTHVTTSVELINRGVPVDLVFQSIAGTEAANTSFGISLATLREGFDAGRSLKRGTLGDNVMYFETGQGSALSADAHGGVDQQTCEARAYAVARAFEPLLVNTVVGFIGPEYLYDGKQIIRAGLEDHFCGKLLGLPLGCDICHTNHAEADQDDMDTLLTLLGTAGVSFIMGIPGSDDVMLNYQSTSFHDSLFLRETLGLKRAPEFEAWLRQVGLAGGDGRLVPPGASQRLFARDAGSGGVSGEAPDAPKPLADAPSDPWGMLRDLTPARVALGRSGGSLPTQEVLRFGHAHALARDAVHKPLDGARARAAIEALGLAVIGVDSAVDDRATYLRRPDLGRQLSGAGRAALEAARPANETVDLAIVVADGLSATAVQANAPALLAALLPGVRAAGWHLAPIVLATQARVALGDDAGAALGARMVLVLIGERPGLSSPDSLGAYLTFAPQVGRRDNERNCVSNIRPAGLSADRAAHQLLWLMTEAFQRGETGVALKDESVTQPMLGTASSSGAADA